VTFSPSWKREREPTTHSNFVVSLSMFSTLQTRLTVDDIALFAANTSHETPEEQCQCRHGHDEMMRATIRAHCRHCFLYPSQSFSTLRLFPLRFTALLVIKTRRGTTRQEYKQSESLHTIPALYRYSLERLLHLDLLLNYIRKKRGGRKVVRRDAYRQKPPRRRCSFLSSSLLIRCFEAL
jgi:hypothetical protein